MVEKIQRFFYWKVYNLETRLARFIVRRLSVFVTKQERPYWILNADRNIFCRRDKEELTHFVQILERERKDLWGGELKKKKCLIKDFRACQKKYGIIAEDYFSRGYHALNEVNRNHIISRWRQYHIVNSLNSVPEVRLIEDKACFAKKFAPFLQRDVLDARECDGVRLQQFLEVHDKVIIKPTNECGGKGIQVIHTRGIDSSERARLQQEIVGEEYIVEEFLEQEGILHDINPSSLNTIRVGTFNGGDDIYISHAFLRTGRKDSLVDNLHSGGVEWPINHQTGIISRKGFDSYGHEYSRHPDSNFQVVGLTIPYWNDAMEYIKQAAKSIPQVKYIAWDLAISNESFALIEANGSGGFGRPFSDEYDMWSFAKKFMDDLLGNDREMRYFNE